MSEHNNIWYDEDLERLEMHKVLYALIDGLKKTKNYKRRSVDHCPLYSEIIKEDVDKFRDYCDHIMEWGIKYLEAMKLEAFEEQTREKWKEYLHISDEDKEKISKG